MNEWEVRRRIDIYPLEPGILTVSRMSLPLLVLYQSGGVLIVRNDSHYRPIS